MSHPYASPDYAVGLAHIGVPFAVPEWDSERLVIAAGYAAD